jgi:hypothetical protein
MGFHELIDKVRQAEDALEARERQTAADWRQVKASWHALWTPGRIVLAGLASGFVVGKARPVGRVAGGSGLLQLASMLSGLFAGGSAQAAAQGAEEAADAADATGAAAAAEAAFPNDAGVAAAAMDAQRVYREAGLP